MKRLLVISMVIILIFANAISFAQEDKVKVASTTKVSGQFFTKLWGNNTSDIDVRNMIHGYSPSVWDKQTNFVIDKTVVKNVLKQKQAKYTKYTIELNQDLVYCDGKTSIKAEDYVFSLLLICSPQLKELGANSLDYSYILGYNDYNSAKSKEFLGVQLLSEYKFAISIKAEYLPYFYELSYLVINPYPINEIAPSFYIATNQKGSQIVSNNKKVLESSLLQENLLNKYMQIPKLSSGPYKLLSYNKDSGVVEFEKNDYYKGDYRGEKPKFKNISLEPCYTDNMAKLIKNGDIDIINKLSNGEIIDELREEQNLNATMYPRLGYAFCNFNCNRLPMKLEYVRKAIAYAVDTQSITKDFTNNYGEPVYGYYGIGQWMYLAANNTILPTDFGINDKKWKNLDLNRLNKYNYNLDLAVKHIVKAGYIYNKDGKNFNKLIDDIRYKKLNGKLHALSIKFAQSKNNEAAQLVANQLINAQKALGMEVIIDTIEFTELLNDYYSNEKQYDMMFLATDFLASFDPSYNFSDNDNSLIYMNTTGIKSNELKNTTWNMHKTKPGDLQNYLSKWQKFQIEFNKTLPSLPIYSNYYFDFCSDKINNYNPS